MKMLIKVLACLIVISVCVENFFASSEVSLTTVVSTEKGDVRGVFLKTVVQGKKYSSFKGIPYAKPPLGKLRFKPPVEADPWPGVFNATYEGPECPQVDQLSLKYNGSEDCLLLNVHTPEVDFDENSKKRLRATFIWIHGGSFKAGSGQSHVYGPDFFIEEDVVIVTFNYRLGPLGFMSIGHPDVLGNVGLKDQNLVLKWVKQNIANFGGDPDNISLSGESAGGVSVDFHILSDMSQGLFHRSISMSASPLCPWAFIPPEKMKDWAFQLAALLNNNTAVLTDDEFLEILYNAPVRDIVMMSDNITTVPVFIPTLEDPEINKDEEKFMTQCYMERYLSGNYSKLPHMMGFTSKEALLFGKSFDNIIEVQKRATNYLHYVDSWVPVISYVGRFMEKIASAVTSYTETVTNQIIGLASDVLFYTGIDLKERILHATGVHEIYYYRISYDASRNSYHQIVSQIHEINGTSHADDLFYLFYISMVNPPLDPNDPMSITRNRMVKMWSNFMKYGNPTPPGVIDPLIGVTWPTSGGLGTHLDIGKSLQIKFNRPIDANVRTYEDVTTSEEDIFGYGCTTESLFSALRRNPLSPINFVFSVFKHMVL